MSTKLYKLFPSLFKTRQENDKLRKENEILSAKLSEKQEQINKTNSYWKGKLHNQQAKRRS